MKKKIIILILIISMLQNPCIALSQNNIGSNNTYSFQDDYDGIERACKSVFYVEIYDKNNEFVGNASGFVAFREHLFITNYHVIEGASYLAVCDEEDNWFILDTLVAIDESNDLAILLFPDGKKYNPLILQVSASLKRGQPVTTIGSPKGYQNTVAFGNISALPQTAGKREIQFTAPISHGSSGGVLFDNQGKVVGITSSVVTEGENIGFAISVDMLEELYQRWDKKTSVSLGKEQSLDSVKWVSNNTTTPNPTTVYYYSNSGSYYHSKNTCRELSGLKSYNMGSATYVQSKGYKPCPFCMSDSTLVYYSNSGFFYHLDKNCTDLYGLNSFSMGSATYAQSKGYMPCPVCTVLIHRNN